MHGVGSTVQLSNDRLEELGSDERSVVDLTDEEIAATFDSSLLSRLFESLKHLSGMGLLTLYHLPSPLYLLNFRTIGSPRQKMEQSRCPMVQCLSTHSSQDPKLRPLFILRWCSI
jgi:hypothetical protein